MDIQVAQRDVRSVFIGGFIGQMVSSLLWAGSASLSTWHSLRAGGLLLVIGGFFIFPTIQLVLKVMGRPHGLRPGHPMSHLAMQVAFTLPLTLPLVLALAQFRPALFYPAFMVALGAHYLPFVFLYGMRLFGVLCVVLVAGGLGCGLYGSGYPVLGAWFTAGVLMAFALAGRAVVVREGDPLRGGLDQA